MECGDYGGAKRDGSPCTRKPGWGVDGTDEGPCKAHNGLKDEKRERQKNEVLELLPEVSTQTVEGRKFLTLEGICRMVGISTTTLWRMRQEDEEFAAAVQEAFDQRDEARGEMVEDALFRDVVSGNHKGGERMFWLANRRPGRWRHMQKIVHVGDEGDDAIQHDHGGLEIDVVPSRELPDDVPQD